MSADFVRGSDYMPPHGQFSDCDLDEFAGVLTAMYMQARTGTFSSAAGFAEEYFKVNEEITSAVYKHYNR